LTNSRHSSDLGDLADPTRFADPIDIDNRRPEEFLRFLRLMLIIRIVEEKIGELVLEGSVKTPCHLGIGQEAVAVGVSAILTSSDRIFGGHRSHSHYLALGGDLYPLIAEVLGKSEGASHGLGGSMHLYGGSVGFHGSVPIVGATIPIAVGAALAAKMDGGRQIAVAFFGDGACEEGVFHESLNFAAVYGLPVLFVVENNLFSSHLHIELRQPSDSIARYAEAHRVRSLVIDGNDVGRVADAAEELVEPMRSGQGPALLEAVTFRFRGHVGPNEDIDVGVHRQMEDVAVWKKRCPILRLRTAMERAGHLSDGAFDRQVDEISSEVEAAIGKAKAAAFPDQAALLDAVYGSGTRS